MTEKQKPPQLTLHTTAIVSISSCLKSPNQYMGPFTTIFYGSVAVEDSPRDSRGLDSSGRWTFFLSLLTFPS